MDDGHKTVAQGGAASTQTPTQSVQDKHSIDSHKMQYHADTVSQWLNPTTIKDVFPTYIEISPVGHCNHRCTFCAVDYIGYKGNKIGTQVLNKTIEDLWINGAKSIMFAGEGEPLLHKQLYQVIQANNKFIDMAITTNGIFLDEIFVNQCIHGLKWIKISCNAGTPRTYSRIHKTAPTDFSRVWDNVRYAVSRKRDTVIGVQSVLLPENEKEMKHLAERAKDSGLDYLVVKPYSHQEKSITTKYKDLSYENTKVPNWVEEMTDASFEVIWRSSTMASYSKGKQYEKCLSTPFFWAYIMATGDVYGCSSHLLNPKFHYGNVNDQCFSDIWYGEKRLKAIDYVKKVLDIKECRKNCRMGS